VHFITGAAHKFHGPKGVGLLYINENVRIKPFIHGGSQERNMRAGTENVYGIVGFAKALEMSAATLEDDSAYIGTLKYYMHEQLKKNIPGVGFNGDVTGRSPLHSIECKFSENRKIGDDPLQYGYQQYLRKRWQRLHQRCRSGQPRDPCSQ
jgi:cysteine desulfurase